MSDAPPKPPAPALDRKELLRLGVERARVAGAWAVDALLGEAVSRLTPDVQRPPGALPELEFLAACTRCGECAPVCPPGAIRLLDTAAGVAAGTPWLDTEGFRPCIGCADTPCIRACPTGALQPTPIAAARLGTAHLDRATCIAWLGGTCARCVEKCPFPGDAILTDEQRRVHIDPRQCIGCGICRHVCPTRPPSIAVERARRI